MYVGKDGLVADEMPQPMPLLLYLDQNYLSGMVKRKPGFRELEPALRAAVTRGAVAVPEAAAHRIESAARPDLPLLELLRELSRAPGSGESDSNAAVVQRSQRLGPSKLSV